MNISPIGFVERLKTEVHLPPGLVVTEDLNLNGCDYVTHLPDNLTIDSNLNLNACINLTHLPEKLEVKGWASLVRCTALTHLPVGLVVHGWLDLNWCHKLTTIPPEIVVSKMIYCDERLINTIALEDIPLYLNNFKFSRTADNHLKKRLRSPKEV